MINYSKEVKEYLCNLIDRQNVNLKKGSITKAEMVCYCNGYIEGVGDILSKFLDFIFDYDKVELKNFAINYLNDKLKE